MKNCISVIACILMMGYSFAQDFDTLTEVQVVSPRTLTVSGKLRDIEGTSVYAGKKTELIQMNNINANLATNNTRQI